jgi:hypothetical protein
MFSFSSKENAGAALPAMVARRATVSETIPFRRNFDLSFIRKTNRESPARDFDLGGGFHNSGSYPMVFQHSAIGKALYSYSLDYCGSVTRGARSSPAG